jgi:branched-chain amino acid transport system substrate-binding protein
LCLLSLLAAASVATGCGSTSDDATTASGKGASTAAKTAVPATPATGVPASAFSQDNPGKADVDRKGQVIRLGYVNDEIGPIAIPAFRIGSEQAVKYINSHGGVNGATVQLDICKTAGTPESSINCANKFIQNGDVAYVAGIDLGTDAVLPALKKAKLPYVSSNMWGAAVKTDPNAHVLEAGAGPLAAVDFEVMKAKGITSADNVQLGGPSGTFAYEGTFKGLGKSYGIKTSADQANPTSPDWSAAVQAAATRGVGAIFGFISEQGCTQMVQAARQASFNGLIFAGACSDFIKTLGDAAVGTYTSAQLYEPDYAQSAPPEIQANLKAYEAAMTAAGQQKLVPGYAALAFSSMVELSKILELVPGAKVDAAGVAKAFNKKTSTPGFLGPRLTCADHPIKAEPSACRADVLALQVVKDGGAVVRKPVNGGTGFTAPKE